MKVDWQKRYRDLEREHKQMVKQLADEMEMIGLAINHIDNADYGWARSTLKNHLPKAEKILKGGNQ